MDTMWAVQTPRDVPRTISDAHAWGAHGGVQAITTLYPDAVHHAKASGREITPREHK